MALTCRLPLIRRIGCGCRDRLYARRASYLICEVVHLPVHGCLGTKVLFLPSWDRILSRIGQPRHYLNIDTVDMRSSALDDDRVSEGDTLSSGYSLCR